MNRTLEEIEDWMIEQLSRRLGVAPQRIDSNQPLTRYGMDSLIAADLTAELEDWLHQSVPITLLEDKPTIKAIARFLSGSKEEPVSESFPLSIERNARSEKGASFSVSQREERFNTTSFDALEPIAIVGLGCRLPGASHPEAFWQLLKNKIEALVDVPAERWDAESFYDPDPSAVGKMPSRRGGFLSNIDLFDPYFFGISPREAVHMDPQQRLLLEVAWETLENAGIAPHSLAGSQSGVFIGISTNDYVKGYFPAPDTIDAYTNTGNAHSIAASRISYILDLQGPSIAIDTACSSSLVAIHLACQSLRTGESTLALAGGVNVMLSPEPTIGFSKARMISLDGHCRSFDAAADGLVRGEGCGMVALRRLSDATANGNRILAVIYGSAVNQDGRSKGLAAPNGMAQQAVIRQAFKQARLSPNQLSYVIGQGTGTPLGDAIELQSLEAVLKEHGSDKQSCAVGSVKANIGHLEAAAGVAGVIAATLALQHEQLPPQLHFQQLNPQVSPAPTCLFIPVASQPWLKHDQPRVAGVSAFSISGTNAHIVLGEAPPQQASTKSELPLHILTLSAPEERALKDLVLNYDQFLASSPDTSLADICFTTNTGRTHFPYRLAAIAQTSDQLRDVLHSYTSGSNDVRLLSGYTSDDEHAKIAFLLSGEGTEYVSMGHELYAREPVFRAAMDQCARLLDVDLAQHLTSVLYPSSTIPSPLSSSTYAQPALFALQYALVTLWRSWGILPDAVMGYGCGAYVAAHFAGALSLEDALMLVAERGQLVETITQANKSLVVHCGEAQLTELLQGFQQVSLVAIHALDRFVINGPGIIVDRIKQTCASQGLETSSTPFQYSSGVSQVVGLPESFGRLANMLPELPLSVPFISTLDGKLLPPGQLLGTDYWQRHLCEPIHFAASIDTLLQQGFRLFLEPGATSALSEIGQALQPDVAWIPCLSTDETQTWQKLSTALATLYVHGRDIDWSAL
ncbi:MAG TPA: beta-ketoacyl synthase N-terminal-like domain-containing protein, partial [Ktedonobacteraceae bacterium]|nr:beta-ketoacyl synthase N-terminal-like domain-containing protein [Ktedonobacteraceae bacterium]